MIKFIIKCIIVLLAIQSAMDYLRKEEIIEGSIKINYPTVQRKLLVFIPTEKIAGSIFDFVSNKVHDTIDKQNQNNDASNSEQHHRDFPSYRIVFHVVKDGETLSELSQEYGVHWRVIQKINHINDEQRLSVGQMLKIPSKVKNLPYFSI